MNDSKSSGNVNHRGPITIIIKTEDETLKEQIQALEIAKSTLIQDITILQAKLVWFEFSTLLPRFILRKVYQNNYGSMRELLFQYGRKTLGAEEHRRYLNICRTLNLRDTSIQSTSQLHTIIKEFKQPRLKVAHADHQTDMPREYYYEVASKLCSSENKIDSLEKLHVIVDKTFNLLGEKPFTEDLYQQQYFEVDDPDY